MLLSKDNWGDGIARPTKRYTGCDIYWTKLDNAKKDMGDLFEVASAAIGWFMNNENDGNADEVEKLRIGGVLNEFFALDRIQPHGRYRRLQDLKGM